MTSGFSYFEPIKEALKALAYEDAYRRVESVYGKIRRARGCYLYTQNGKRVVDMWLDGGRALLGRRYGRSQIVFKDILERGITMAAGSTERRRLDRAVKRTLLVAGIIGKQNNSAEDPLIIVRYFRDYERAAAACGKFAAHTHTRILLWRPWLFGEVDFFNIDASAVLFIQTPLSWTESPVVAVFFIPRNESANETDLFLPDGDPISAPFVGAAARSFDDLSNELLSRSLERYRRFDGYLANRWSRNGAYLFSGIKRSDYGDFFNSSLKKGVMLSPYPELPSILPYEIDPRDLKSIFS